MLHGDDPARTGVGAGRALPGTEGTGYSGRSGLVQGPTRTPEQAGHPLPVAHHPEQRAPLVMEEAEAVQGSVRDDFRARTRIPALKGACPGITANRKGISAAWSLAQVSPRSGAGLAQAQRVRGLVDSAAMGLWLLLHLVTHTFPLSRLFDYTTPLPSGQAGFTPAGGE